MSDSLTLTYQQSIQSESGNWYRTLDYLGRGASAVTYLMLCTSGPFKGVPVATKLFRRVSLPERRDRFLQECEFLKNAEHPSIMRTIDEGVYLNEHPFLVVEFQPRTLADVIRGQTETLVEKISFTLQILSGLRFLAELPDPVIHRDLKPQNIFVKGKSCVIGDFGLMKLQQSTEEDREAALLESVGPRMPFFYRSPDQVSYARGDSDISTKSDVFQLGLIAAELFTGRNPQRRVEHDDALSDVVLDGIGFIPGFLHAPIRNLLEKMLAMTPQDRPPAAEIMDHWQGLMVSAADRVRATEGRVF